MVRQTFFFPSLWSQITARDRKKKSRLNVLCVRSIPRDELTTSHFLKGVCTLEKNKNKKKIKIKIKKKKMEKLGGWERELRTP